MEDARLIMQRLRQPSAQGVVLHARFDSRWDQVLFYICLHLPQSLTKDLGIVKFCEQSKIYNCDSRTGEVERFLTTHNVPHLSVVYLITDLRYRTNPIDHTLVARCA